MAGGLGSTGRKKKRKKKVYIAAWSVEISLGEIRHHDNLKVLHVGPVGFRKGKIKVPFTRPFQIVCVTFGKWDFFSCIDLVKVL